MLILRLLVPLALSATLATAGPPTYFARAKIKDAAGAEVASIKFYPEKAKIELPGQTLESRDPSGQKIKYKDVETGTVAYEVKLSTPGNFKLRQPDGTLLWKVKSGPEGITVADNESGEAPIVVAGDTLADDGRPVGRTNQSSSASNRAKLSDPSGDVVFAAEWTFPPPPAALALWMAMRIPADQRAIIVAELIRPTPER